MQTFSYIPSVLFDMISFERCAIYDIIWLLYFISNIPAVPIYVMLFDLARSLRKKDF